MNNTVFTKTEKEILIKLTNYRGWLNFAEIFQNLDAQFIKTINSLLTKNIVKDTFSSILKCPKCQSTIKKGTLKDFLTCGNCFETFDLTQDLNKPFFSSYSIDPNGIANYLLSEFKNIKQEPDLTDNLKSSSFIKVGNFETIPIIINVKPPNFLDIQSLIGYLFNKTKFAIVLRFNEFRNEVEEYFRLFGSTLISISLERSTSQIIKEFELLTKKIKTIDQTTADIDTVFDNFSNILPKELIDEENIIQLSYNGGEKFQIPSINLLWPLGIPYPLKKERYRPDGLLYLPKKVYLIDAKSCNKPYEFNTSSRDQMKRYIKGLSAYNQQSPVRKVAGIIILTRDIDQKSIKQVVGFGEEHDFSGDVRIITIRNLIQLYKNVQTKLEYWHRFHPESHPDLLFNGETGALSKVWKDSRLRLATADSKVHLIDEELFNSYYKKVMEAPFRQIMDVQDINGAVNALLYYFNI